jgi:hypothetical protein
MKNFLPVIICILFTTFLSAQDTLKRPVTEDKCLNLGLGFGTYQQGTLKGHNLAFSADYKINKQYTIGQMSQFAFISTNAMGQKLSYINQHISLVGMTHLIDNRYASIMAGAGLGYTNYHTIQVKKTPVFEHSLPPANPYMVTTQAKVQLTFPVMFDASFKLSKTLSLGARVGSYIATQNGFFNYSFVNPVVKVSL